MKVKWCSKIGSYVSSSACTFHNRGFNCPHREKREWKTMMDVLKDPNSPLLRGGSMSVQHPLNCHLLPSKSAEKKKDTPRLGDRTGDSGSFW